VLVFQSSIFACAVWRYCKRCVLFGFYAVKALFYFSGGFASPMVMVVVREIHSNNMLRKSILPRCFVSLVYASVIPFFSMMARFTLSLKSMW